MSAQGYKLITKSVLPLILATPLFVFAGPAAFDESTRELVTPCVEPYFRGLPSLRKVDNQRKTHQVTMQFDEDYSVATVTAASKVIDPADCTATWETFNGYYYDQIMVDGNPVGIALKYAGGASFNVVKFPYPESKQPEHHSLWRVSDGSDEIIIGGVLDAALAEYWTYLGLEGIDYLLHSDFPLPAEFEEAYEQSARLVTQVSPTDYQASESTLSALAQSSTPLNAVLSPAVYARLNNWFLNNQGAHVPQFANVITTRPVWIADLIKLLAVKNYLVVNSYGVETYVQDKAAEDFKPNWGMESPTSIMATMNINAVDMDPDAIVTEALDYVDDKNYRDNIDALIEAWRTGDQDFLDQALVEPDRQGLIDDFNRLYGDRFATWLAAFEDFFDNTGQEFVLLNVKYLVGPDGFLTYLEQAGYTVEYY